MAEREGQRLGSYRLLRLLGRGGFAEVYLGEHTERGIQVAVKVLHAQLTSIDLERFRAEASTIARLSHPNIVRLLGFDVQEGTPFLVMEYAADGTLRERYPRGKPLAVETILPYVRQIADALQYAHDQRLIHRDVKPENLLLGANGKVLLSDFGIATVAQSSHSQSTKEAVGTVAYMAPEQIQGHPRPASDLYALGVVVYEWLTGEPPFRGSFTEIATQHLFALPQPLRERVPGILPAVEEVVLMALAKDPRQRFRNVSTLALALGQASQGISPLHFAPTQITPPTPVPFSPSLLLDPTIPARTPPGSMPPGLVISPGASNAGTGPTTLARTARPSSGATRAPARERGRRTFLVSALMGILALLLILTVGTALYLSRNPRSTTSLAAANTATPTFPIVWTLMPTGTLVPATMGTPTSGPTGTAAPTLTPTPMPTGTLVPPTNTPPPTSTPAPAPTSTSTPMCSTPSGTTYFDDFSSYTPGQPPTGYLLRGASGVSPTIEEVGGTGPAYRLLNFPAVSNQYWDRWVLKNGLMLCNSYVVTVKLNFQTSGDRAGLAIAWNDADWDRIDIQPNVFYQNIEFRITYTGSVSASPVVSGSALNRYSLPMTTNTDYWLRVAATSTGPGQGQVVVYWSTDGTNFTSVVTATGLANISGLVGMSTSGPNLPDTDFDDFSMQET